MIIDFRDPLPLGGKKYRLQDIVWEKQEDLPLPPYWRGDISEWCNEEPGTVECRIYPATVTFSYLGYSGVTDWTADGEGCGIIMYSTRVVFAKLRRKDFEADVDTFIQRLNREILDHVWYEWGWPE